MFHFPNARDIVSNSIAVRMHGVYPGVFPGTESGIGFLFYRCLASSTIIMASLKRLRKMQTPSPQCLGFSHGVSLLAPGGF